MLARHNGSFNGRLAMCIKWRACDVEEAKEGLENKLWLRWSNLRVGEWAVTYVKRQKGWRMSCEVGEATKGSLQHEISSTGTFILVINCFCIKTNYLAFCFATEQWDALVDNPEHSASRYLTLSPCWYSSPLINPCKKILRYSTSKSTRMCA